jgi:hypothetical protein
MMVALTRRSRLFRRLQPIVDGLFDKARRKVEDNETEAFERSWFGGTWQKSHAFSPEIEIVEHTSGNPLNTLGRAIDCVHRGEIVQVALIGIGADGVIHTAWSDGDCRMLSLAARFLADDLKKAGRG